YIGNLSGSQGTVTVDGAKSSWNSFVAGSFIGYGGAGSVTIQNGATGSGSTQYVGYLSGSQGLLSVTGQGSTSSNRGALYVGYGGTGEMDITAGAKATQNSAAYIGFQA